MSSPVIKQVIDNEVPPLNKIPSESKKKIQNTDAIPPITEDNNTINIAGIIEKDPKTKEKIIENKLVPFQVDFKEFGNYNDKISIILRRMIYKKLYEMFANYKVDVNILIEIIYLLIDRLEKYLNGNQDIIAFFHLVCNDLY